MNIYNVIALPKAEEDLDRIVYHLVNKKHNPYAARNVLNDYSETITKLSYLADSQPIPDSAILRDRKLKRFKFSRHDYFLLFSIEGNTVIITNIFHAREDYENKLR